MNLVITEPATLGTDWFMAALALFWSLRLRGSGASASTADWSRAFAFLAMASFIGGAYHGFQAMLPDPVPHLLWRATVASSAVASLFLLRAGLGQFGEIRSGPWWLLAHAKFALALLAGLAWPEFLVVLADFALSVLIVTGFVLQGPAPLSGARGTFLAGVVLFGIGAAVQAIGFAPHPSFNHNDLFHVIQITGNWMFYRSVRFAD